MVPQKCQSLMQINGQAGCHQTQSDNEDRTYSSRSQDSVSPFWPSRVSSFNGAGRGYYGALQSM